MGTAGTGLALGTLAAQLFAGRAFGIEQFVQNLIFLVDEIDNVRAPILVFHSGGGRSGAGSRLAATARLGFRSLGSHILGQVHKVRRLVGGPRQGTALLGLGQLAAGLSFDGLATGGATLRTGRRTTSLGARTRAGSQVGHQSAATGLLASSFFGRGCWHVTLAVVVVANSVMVVRSLLQKIRKINGGHYGSSGCSLVDGSEDGCGFWWVDWLIL